MKIAQPVLLACALATAPMAAAAQNPPDLAPGSIIRLSSPAFSGRAVLLAETADSIRITIGGARAPISIPVGTITFLEARRPATASDRIRRGMIPGAAVGVAVGFSYAMQASVATMFTGEEPNVPLIMASGIGAGALVGAGISLLIPQKRWDPVSVSARAGALDSGGVRVRLSLAF